MTGVDSKFPLESQRTPEETYITIRSSVISAQNRVSSAVNAAMVTAYHEIGEQIYRACGDNDRAGYGKRLLEYLSNRLIAEFGEGFTVRNLRAMRQFYSVFPIRHTLCAELSWSHYRLLMRIADKEVRDLLAHPSGHRPDADVCQLLHQRVDERERQSAYRHHPLRRKERRGGEVYIARGQQPDIRLKILHLSADRGRIEA